MKHLLFLVMALTFISIGKAQSVDTTIDASKYVTISGGDGTATIASYTWTASSTSEPFTITAPTLSQSKFSFTKEGDYAATLVVRDTKGNTGSGVLKFKVYAKQLIIIDFSKSIPNGEIPLYLK